jgi:hypothetical protein
MFVKFHATGDKVDSPWRDHPILLDQWYSLWYSWFAGVLRGNSDYTNLAASIKFCNSTAE